MTSLTPDLLLHAYAVGIFPMAESRDDRELFWVDPEQRGILPLDGFHVPKRLGRTLRSGGFEIRIDSDFRGVMQGCAEPTPDRPNTWINPEIEQLYTALFERGHAHSVECWRADRMVGGLYGVALGAAFFGESMFSRETDASKVALVHLVARLKAGGFCLLDTQFVTSHLARFGAVEIPRSNYRRLLSSAVRKTASFPRDIKEAELEAILKRPSGEADHLQSTTQTS